MSDDDIAASYSDEALKGAIAQLSKADYLGVWGKKRLEKLMAEARKRNLKINLK